MASLIDLEILNANKNNENQNDISANNDAQNIEESKTEEIEENSIDDDSIPNVVSEYEVLQFDMTFERDLREDTLGMTITSGSVTIRKDSNNLIGISIGGGAPLCPCLYIVQIFDGTAAQKDRTLQSGDELVAVNSVPVKGKTKVDVAKMIQSAKEEVVINYNKLHADPQQGKSLDIVLKKVKHRLVENMSTSTADALGLSRAILCNDTLVKKLQELQDTELMYRGLVEHSKNVLKAHVELHLVIKQLGDVFAGLAVREPQPRASEAFRLFGEQHRNMEKNATEMIKKVKPVLSDMGTYLYKAIPDTRLTVKKYADAKFEYLAYCLKVKEMDDEECSFAALQEPLYRVETGNYEYRLILRCRQVARAKFAKLRSDVLVKMELLDNKHVQSLGGHLSKLIKGLSELHSATLELLDCPALFPVEVDLSNSAFQYKSTTPINVDNYNDNESMNDEDHEIENGEEVKEPQNSDLLDIETSDNFLNIENQTENSPLLSGFELEDSKEPDYSTMDNISLLSSLNLHDKPANNSSNFSALLPDLTN